MEIVKYEAIYHDKVIQFLKDVVIGEFKLTDWEEYIENKDLDVYLSGNNNFLIILENDEIIATCGLLDIGDKTGKINSFYVKKDYRRKGFGRVLLMKQDFFAGLHFDEVILCNNKVFNSLPFYEKFKFTPYRYETNGEIWCKRTYK